MSKPDKRKRSRSEYHKEYYSRPGIRERLLKHRRNIHLVRHYGITEHDYELLLNAQAGVCATCSRPEIRTKNRKTDKLSVDHDHKTGKVRGLLCYKCNVALGMVSDSIDRLKSLISYLERHNANND